MIISKKPVEPQPIIYKLEVSQLEAIMILYALRSFNYTRAGFESEHGKLIMDMKHQLINIGVPS